MLIHHSHFSSYTWQLGCQHCSMVIPVLAMISLICCWTEKKVYLKKFKVLSYTPTVAFSILKSKIYTCSSIFKDTAFENQDITSSKLNSYWTKYISKYFNCYKNNCIKGVKWLPAFLTSSALVDRVLSLLLGGLITFQPLCSQMHRAGSTFKVAGCLGHKSLRLTTKKNPKNLNLS